MHSISGAAAATPPTGEAMHLMLNLVLESMRQSSQVLGGGEEAGDVEQRFVGDAVAGKRARCRHRTLRLTVSALGGMRIKDLDLLLPAGMVRCSIHSLSVPRESMARP